MDFYRRSYHTLFNAITDALRAMEDQNFGLARDKLIRSQQICEERYMEEGSEDDSSDPSLFSLYFFRPTTSSAIWMALVAAPLRT